MTSSESAHPGTVIVVADAAGTALFTVTALVAAVRFRSDVQWVAAIVALSLFLIGIVAFLWSFYNAVQRSRAEQVAVTQLYLLIGGAAPGWVKTRMLLLLGVQIVVGLGTALARPNALDGSPGTSLALGVLVPMFGLGLNGLWAAFHGTFGERQDDVAPNRPADRDEVDPTVRTSDHPIGKNDGHG